MSQGEIYCCSAHLSLNVSSFWIGFPVSVGLPYNRSLARNLPLTLGATVGRGTHFFPGGKGGLVQGGLTLGNQRANLTTTGGWMKIINGDAPVEIPVVNVSGTVQLGNRLALIGESICLLGIDKQFAFSPALRWDSRENRWAIQAGSMTLWNEDFAKGKTLPMGSILLPLDRR